MVRRPEIDKGKVSPDGTTGYIAFLSAPGYDSVLIQKLDTSNFRAMGEPITIKGAKEGT
jgi:hypothetical protein